VGVEIFLRTARGFEFLVRSGTNSFCFMMAVINHVVSLSLLCIILRPERRGRRCLRLSEVKKLKIQLVAYNFSLFNTLVCVSYHWEEADADDFLTL
jgi:hypothetical protein